MPFEKGNKEAAKKGKHEKTKQWETLAETIVGQHTERFNNILASCEDELFLRYYTEILEYFKPRLQRTELKADVSVTTPKLPEWMKDEAES